MAETHRTAEPAAGEGLYARLRGKLGVSGIHSDCDLANLVEKRLSTAAIQALVQGGLSDLEVYQLVIPRRTLSHRVARRQPLSREESDRAVRVARVTAMAEETFGDTERAWRWMRKPKRRFDGQTPLELLATDAGARLVEELITQLDYGLVA